MLEADLAAVGQHVFGHAAMADHRWIAAGADGIDRARPFVPRNARTTRALPAADHFDVGSADAASAGANSHLVRSWLRQGPIFQLQPTWGRID
jgi:hypothetical protein